MLTGMNRWRRSVTSHRASNASTARQASARGSISGRASAPGLASWPRSRAASLHRFPAGRQGAL